MFVAAALIARHNMRKGRRGPARRLPDRACLSRRASASGCSLQARRGSPTEMGRFFAGSPVGGSALLWLLYLALEPYVRAFWPSTVVSVVAPDGRQWRDPLVGRDILFGVGLGRRRCSCCSLTTPPTGARLRRLAAGSPTSANCSACTSVRRANPEPDRSTRSSTPSGRRLRDGVAEMAVQPRMARVGGRDRHWR